MSRPQKGAHTMPPRVSLIIPCKPGAAAALPVTPSEEVEVLVVTGTNVSQQRNLAAQAARADLLYFLDDDSQLSPGVLELALSTMEQGWAAVGGPNLTRSGATRQERLFGAILASRAATLVTRARNCPVGPAREVDGQELISCNLLVRRDWFERVGGFDVNLYPGEDVEFVQRVRAAGGRLFYHPGIAVERSRRDRLGAFLWQYFRYGLARGALFLHLRPLSQLVYLLPLLLWFGLPWLYRVYLLICLAAGLEVAYREGALQGLRALLVVPCLHLVYGLGVGLGLAYRLLGFSMNRPDQAMRVTVHGGPP